MTAISLYVTFASVKQRRPRRKIPPATNPVRGKLTSRLISPGDERLLYRLDELLSAADQAFQNVEYFEFPAELLDIPAHIAALQNWAGKKKPIRTPFWDCVVALDKMCRKLKLVRRLEALFARPRKMHPGPHTALRASLKDKKSSAANMEAIECVDTIINPVLRGSDGKVKFCGAKPTNDDLRKCSQLLTANASEPLQFFARMIRSNVAGYTDKLLDYAAFLEFYWRSRDWMERYYQPLVELTRLGEFLAHPPLFEGLKTLIEGDYPNEAAITKLKEDQEVENARLRTKKSRRKSPRITPKG